MIDRSLNYGRHQIARFLQNNRSVWVLITAKPTSRVLDRGAGHGTDLTTARRVLPESQLIAVESWPPYVEELKSLGVSVFALNIERDALPFEDGSVDIVIANQILEHTKEFFWIFHQVSRVCCLSAVSSSSACPIGLRCTIEFFSRADGSRHR